jgi:hypothetical protein
MQSYCRRHVFDDIHGIDPCVMSMYDRHIPDSAPTHNEDLGDHTNPAPEPVLSVHATASDLEPDIDLTLPASSLSAPVVTPTEPP